ncbi:MAG: hypothetical protein QXY88_03600 [Candidatus Bathyarchaeia archaeon]
MKAFIASIVSLVILLFAVIEAADYISLNIKLIQDVQPAFKGDYTNATENIAETITDYTISYTYFMVIMAILGPFIGIILGLLGL